MFKSLFSFKGMESAAPRCVYSFRSSIPLNVEKLRDKWIKYFSELKKTPIEIDLAKKRAQQDSQDKDSIQRSQRVGRKLCRPITDLYASPRTTKRMSHVLNTYMSEQQSIQGLSDKLYYHLCPQCGFFKNNQTPEEHGEQMRQRLKRFLTENPSLCKVVKS